jgi:hypothetical protein
VTLSPIERLMRGVEANVSQRWGGGYDRLSWDLLSWDLKRALLAEGLLVLSVNQDESIDDGRVREILNDGWMWIIDREDEP